MTKYEVLKLAYDFENKANRDKYYQQVKGGGLTEEGQRVWDILCEEKVFNCPECGEMVAFADFSDFAKYEHSFQDFMNDFVTCEACENCHYF